MPQQSLVTYIKTISYRLPSCTRLPSPLSSVHRSLPLPNHTYCEFWHGCSAHIWSTSSTLMSPWWWERLRYQVWSTFGRFRIVMGWRTFRWWESCRFGFLGGKRGFIIFTWFSRKYLGRRFACSCSRNRGGCTGRIDRLVRLFPSSFRKAPLPCR